MHTHITYFGRAIRATHDTCTLLRLKPERSKKQEGLQKSEDVSVTITIHVISLYTSEQQQLQPQ